jgi:hypothetical protein
VDQRALAALWSKPCPASWWESKEHVAIVIAPDATTIGVTPSVFTDVTLDELGPKLREIKATPAFAKRTDLAYTTVDRVDVATLLPVIAAMHAGGFTGARWVPPEWIPMRFPSNVGFDPSPRLISNVSISVADAKLEPNSGLTVDEVHRVVKARSGIYRACYHKELARTPKIAGTLTVTAEVTREGRVEQSRSRGSLESGPVQTCVDGNFMRLKFPPKPAKTRFTIALTFRAN